MVKVVVVAVLINRHKLEVLELMHSAVAAEAEVLLVLLILTLETLVALVEMVLLLSDIELQIDFLYTICYTGI